MDLISIPTIMVISYLITEIFKLFIKKKYLPVVAGVSGLILGIISFYLVPELIGNTNLLTSIAIGIVSGLAATGSNQILKQIRKEE
jgi:uncharacterized membrane protein YuzA (DUF378 family)